MSGTVDVNTTGTYTLTYTVSDAAGNEASLTRTVNVVEGQASTHTADLNATCSFGNDLGGPGHFYDGAVNRSGYAGARGHPDQWILLRQI